MPTIDLPLIIAFVQQNPWVLGAAAVLLLALYGKYRKQFKNRRRSHGNTDGKRLFTPAQKAEGARRAGNGRCEHKHPIWFRCFRKGAHGDHIYPHSRGGATAMSNLQMLCPKHNLAKSATIPSPLYVWRLERRRARYFPQGVSPKVEWRADRAW